MSKKLLTVAMALSFVAAACGSDDATDAAETAETTVTTEAAMEEEAGPVTGPATITADDQSGDGTTVTVSTITLPTDGFVVIHADNDGAPGPIIGWSDLLPAGDSSNIVVTLNTPLDADAKVFPMAHVDDNANGEYEFLPPDFANDVPATTADGKVAVLGINYTLS